MCAELVVSGVRAGVLSEPLEGEGGHATVGSVGIGTKRKQKLVRAGVAGTGIPIWECWTGKRALCPDKHVGPSGKETSSLTRCFPFFGRAMLPNKRVDRSPESSPPQSQTTVSPMTIVSSSTHPLLLSIDQPRRHKKMLRDGSGEVWPDHAELLFSKAIQEYDRQSNLASANSHYPPDLPSRNEFIVRYLRDRGLERTKQQVASHIQQLKKRSSKELAAAGVASVGSMTDSPSPSLSHVPSIYQSQGSAPPTPSSVTSFGSNLAPYYSQSQYGYAHTPAPPPPSSAHNPITSVAIRVNEGHPLTIPISSNSRTPIPQHSDGASLTAISASPTGYGISLRVRLIIPPHQDPLTHLASSRIFALVSLSGAPSSYLPSMTLANKISVNNIFLLEETDRFMVQGNQLLCPLRMSPQSGVMVAAQGPGQSFSF